MGRFAKVETAKTTLNIGVYKNFCPYLQNYCPIWVKTGKGAMKMTMLSMLGSRKSAQGKHHVSCGRKWNYVYAYLETV